MWKEMEVGGSLSLDSVRELCKQALSNSGYTQYAFTPYSNRVKNSTGGCAVDTTNKTIYAYLEFTANGAQGSATDYRAVGSLTPSLASSYLPTGITNKESLLITDLSSDKSSARFTIYKPSSSTDLWIALAYSQTVSDNQKFIVFGIWQY